MDFTEWSLALKGVTSPADYFPMGKIAEKAVCFLAIFPTGMLPKCKFESIFSLIIALISCAWIFIIVNKEIFKFQDQEKSLLTKEQEKNTQLLTEKYRYYSPLFPVDKIAKKQSEGVCFCFSLRLRVNFHLSVWLQEREQEKGKRFFVFHLLSFPM